MSRSKAVGSQASSIPSTPSLVESDCAMSPTDNAKRTKLGKKRHHSERTGFEVRLCFFLATGVESNMGWYD